MRGSIKKILKESEEWFDSVSNDFANTELPFEVIGLRNKPTIKNMFIIKSLCFFFIKDLNIFTIK